MSLSINSNFFNKENKRIYILENPKSFSIDIFFQIVNILELN